jgi:hypothetical protein
MAVLEVKEAGDGAAGRDFVRSEGVWVILSYDGSTGKCEAIHSVFGSSFLPSNFFNEGDTNSRVSNGNNMNAESMSG